LKKGYYYLPIIARKVKEIQDVPLNILLVGMMKRQGLCAATMMCASAWHLDPGTDGCIAAKKIPRRSFC